MEDQLSNIEQYNNAGALLGLDGEDLMGAIRRIKDPAKRVQTFNKLTSAPPASHGSRAEMEKMFGELPAHIKEGLKKGELRLADTIVYSIKPVTSKTIKLFETQDDKQIGLRNISNAKLPKNQVLLVSGIILLAGVSADTTPDKVMATNFIGLEGFPALASGETNLKSNKKQIMPETSNNAFKTAGLHRVRQGYYKLSNPRLILDDVLIELTVELGTMEGIAANTQLFVGLEGTITTP